MTVYFIATKSPDSPVKIGYTENVERRLRELQNMSPLQLHVLWTLDNAGRDVERQLHERFREHRLWGEWFKREVLSEAFLTGLYLAGGTCDWCPKPVRYLLIDLIDLIPRGEPSKHALVAVRRTFAAIAAERRGEVVDYGSWHDLPAPKVSELGPPRAAA
jgi:hypothetical protein